MCKEHLNPGGVMSLWIPFYESNSDTIKSVLATFFKVFPNGIVWSNDENGSGYDAVLFGQVEPTVIDVDKWQERLDRPENAAVKESLEEVGFHDAVDLLATYAARAADLGEWMSTAQINTDRNLRLQYLAGMSLNNYQETRHPQRDHPHLPFPQQFICRRRRPGPPAGRPVENPQGGGVAVGAIQKAGGSKSGHNPPFATVGGF